jgi:lysophospholipase L1-like esterase
VVNRGISGDDALGITNRLVQILPYKPKAIFLMCGTNDMSHHLTAEQVFYKVKGVIDSIRVGAPDTKLYVQSLLPFNESFGRWKNLQGRTDDVPVVNQMLKKYCEEQGITYVELFPYFTNRHNNVLLRFLSVDGLHLSKQGYRIWAERLRPYVIEANKD